MKILVSVMSFNRGKYLRNCIESIINNFKFDYSLIVVDDHSDDPETLTILNELAAFNSVIKPVRSSGSAKHKGLYANMNYALAMAKEQQFDILAIFQDDTQVIRKVQEGELKTIKNILSLPEFAVVVPLFFKKNHQKDYNNLISFHNELSFYYAKSKDQIYLNGIADIGFFSVNKLAACKWQFQDREGLNIELGRQLGMKRAVLKDPFLAYLPWPKTYRHRITNFNDLFTFITDYFFEAGFHPFNTLEGESLLKLINRAPNVIPFAEDYLTLRNAVKLKSPWNYYESSYPIRAFVKSILRGNFL